MTWWHRLWRRNQMDEQLEKELRFHLEQHTTDLIAQGYDPAEARRLIARFPFSDEQRRNIDQLLEAWERGSSKP